MNRLYNYLTLVLGLCCWAATAGAAIPVDGVAAKVNQRVITVGEVVSALQPIERRLSARYSGTELMLRMEEAYEQVLQSMIERALIIEEFNTREIDLPRQVIDQQTQAIVTEEFGGDRSQFIRALAEEGMSMEDWRDQTRDRMAVMIMQSEYVTPNILISPRQIRDAYEARLDEFRIEAADHVAMITLARDDETEADTALAEAETLVARARDGESFADLARTYSTDAMASQGGVRGWIDPARVFREEIAEAVAALAPGEISEVITTSDAFYIVQLMDRREQQVQSLEDVREQLTADLRRAEEDRVYRTWISRLQTRHHIHIPDAQQSARQP